jgi:hypothetical protein
MATDPIVNTVKNLSERIASATQGPSRFDGSKVDEFSRFHGTTVGIPGRCDGSEVDAFSGSLGGLANTSPRLFRTLVHVQCGFHGSSVGDSCRFVGSRLKVSSQFMISTGELGDSWPRRVGLLSAKLLACFSFRAFCL